MENSGEAVDDQGSGWLEVKKKHRSSSKFSLQSWVGGLSRRNASSCGQPLVKEKDARTLGKCEQDPGRNSAVHSQSTVGSSASTSKEDQKGLCSPYKCEIKEDSESPELPSVVGSSNDRSGDTEDISHKDKAQAPPSFKWGDLEDDALVQHHEKTVGLGAVIKFGDIGDDSILACRKHDNDSDLVLCHPCKNPLENKLVVTSMDADSVSVQTPLLICKHDAEQSQNEVIKASSKDMEVPVVNVTLANPDDDVSNCKEIYTEHIKRINNDELSPGCLSSEEVVLDVKIQEPVRLDTVDMDSKDGQNRNEDSNSAVIAQDELCSLENTGIEYSGESIPSASVENHGSDSISKAQIMSALGESSTGESKERFRERLWCFLFENLNRAVDELYLLCELECDLEQMKEAILVLQEAASDFKELKARVEEFENVKKSTLSVDGVPITLKSDHRRPHALSWEVRRMTTSPHRAEILSSSLEAFKQIQQERDKSHQTRDAKHPGLGCRNQRNVSGVYPYKAAQVSDLAFNTKDTVTKSKSLNRGSDLSPANLAGEKRNVESGRSSKARPLQSGRVHSQTSYSSDANSSRISQKDGVAAKSKREQGGLESVKMGSRKEKIMTESIVEKNPRDVLKKQISLHEKDNEKEKRNVNTWKSMDAWKEKRNWEDILSSPFRVSSRASHSPGLSRRSAERARILHDKLMSPEKKKKTAFDMKREAEEKHARAMRIRSELENERVQKLQRTSEKLNRVNEWQAVRSMKLREGMYARQQRSESRHEAFLAQVARRAGDESSKVNEVRFITSLNEENKKLILRQKLHDSELRRAEKLQVIKAKQKEDMAREEAVLERKKLIEAEKLQRLAETQRKKEEAQIRREEERRASSAAREARTIEQLRRKEERVRAQQEEAELLAQKLVERLKESEQRRKFYLEQIRERASTDFRDQTSPLLRRSMNREGQSRNTPTNNSEDYQLNSVSGLGDSTLANGTQQHSLKRRIKRLRQRLMALKFEFSEPSIGSENATTIGYRTAVGTARAKIGRWLQELQRHRQARKEGAASIGLITAEMIKFLDGKEPELQASRQAGLLDFIASALPASHTSKPEACQVTIHLLKLLRIILSAPANRSYFLAQNLLPPIIPMLSAALENYIKIAASVNIPGNTNSLSSKTSVENFESVSEVLDGFLWTVTTIIGHISSDERQLQMWDGLLELLIAYQVIHRLHELFALYDRPQVEGSPFPSSILLSLYLLIALTSRPGFKSSIDWESFPIENVVGKESEAILADSIDTRNISVNNSCKDCTPPPSALNDNTVVSLPDVPEDRPLDELCNKTNKYGNSVSIIVDIEKKPTYSSLDLSNCKTDVPLESQKIMEGIPKSFVHEKDEKRMVDLGAEQKNQNKPNLKQPVAFLLSAISETGLVSLPSLLTAVLLQANNRLSAEQGSNVLPSNFEEVATAVLKVLNNLALLDIKFMQRILARPDLRMEFFHLMSFLLSYCTNEWKAASDQVGLLLFESLFLLGHFSLFHPGNQAVLRWGKSPTILHKVCDLPFVFFSDPELMPVLAGTLVAACFGCEQNKDVVQQELSLDMLLSLLRSCKNVVPANSDLDNALMENSSECNQLGLEFKKSQVDSLRSSRQNVKSTRGSLGKGGNAKGCKMRNQRSIKPYEDLPLKHSLSASETCALMLHCRFPMSFLEKAEQFFSAGTNSE